MVSNIGGNYIKSVFCFVFQHCTSANTLQPPESFPMPACQAQPVCGLLLLSLCHSLHVTTYMLPAVVIMIATFQTRLVLTDVLGHALHALYINVDKSTLVI